MDETPVPVPEPVPAEATSAAAAEPVAAPEPVAAAATSAVAASEPFVEPVAAPEPVAADDPVPAAIASSIDLAPADAVLVPLEQIAPQIEQASLSRRAFLGFGVALAGGVAGATVLGQLFPVFASAEDQVSPIVPGYDPKAHAWTFVVDTASCIGCGLCVVACKEENHVPESSEFTRTWVERHTTMTDGSVYVDAPDAGINGFPATSTAPGAEGKTAKSSFFEPHLCMQCADSPCTGVCPVSATYKTEDGIILVDARRCIGCGFCVVSCPYGARYITPADEDTPASMPGVADKCTWCYHRINRGQVPACVEICPVGARRFGDANDPASTVRSDAVAAGAGPLHPEYGTQPRVLYLGPTLGEA